MCPAVVEVLSIILQQKTGRIFFSYISLSHLYSVSDINMVKS